MELSLNPQIMTSKLAPTMKQDPPDHIRKAGVRLRRQRAKNEHQLIPHQLNRIAQDHQVIIANILHYQHVSMHNNLSVCLH
jgi:hypothetical protein